MAKADGNFDLKLSNNTVVGKVKSTTPIKAKAGESSEKFNGSFYVTNVSIDSSSPITMAILQDSKSTAIQWPCTIDYSGKYKKAVAYKHYTELTCIMPIYFTSYTVGSSDTLNFLALLSDDKQPVTKQAGAFKVFDLSKAVSWADAMNALAIAIPLFADPQECPNKKITFFTCSCPDGEIYNKGIKKCMAISEPAPVTPPVLPFSGTLYVEPNTSDCPAPKIIDPYGICTDPSQQETPKSKPCSGNLVLMLDGTCGASCLKNETANNGSCVCNDGFTKDPDRPVCIIDDGSQNKNANTTTSGSGGCSLIVPEAKATPTSTGKSFALQILNTLIPTASPESAGNLDNVGVTYVKGSNGKNKTLTITGIVLKGSHGVPLEFVAMDMAGSPANTLVPENNYNGTKRCMGKTTVTSATFKCIYSVSSNKLTEDSKLSAFLFFPDNAIAFTPEPIVLKDLSSDTSTSVIKCDAPKVPSSDGKTCVTPQKSGNTCVAPASVRLFEGSCGTVEECKAYEKATVNVDTFECECPSGLVANLEQKKCLPEASLNQNAQTPAGRNCSLDPSAASDTQAILLFEMIVSSLAIWRFLRKLAAK